MALKWISRVVWLGQFTAHSEVGDFLGDGADVSHTLCPLPRTLLQSNQLLYWLRGPVNRVPPVAVNVNIVAVI